MLSFVACGGVDVTPAATIQSPVPSRETSVGGNSQPRTGPEDLLYPLWAYEESVIVVANVTQSQGIDPEYVYDPYEVNGAANLLYRINVEHVIQGSNVIDGANYAIRVSGVPKDIRVGAESGGWEETDEPPLEVNSRYLLILYPNSTGLLTGTAPDRLLINNDGTVELADPGFPATGGVAALSGLTLAEAEQFIVAQEHHHGPGPAGGSEPVTPTVEPVLEHVLRVE